MIGPTETLHLDAGESITRMFRASQFQLTHRLILPLTLLVLLFLFLFPLFRYGARGVGIFFSILFLDLLFFFRMFLEWYGTVYVLTSRRLLSFRRKGLFKKNTQEILLENISELSYDMRGALHVLFRVGDVKLALYTASHTFVLHDLAHPQGVLTAISRQIAGAKRDIASHGVGEIIPSEDNLKKGKVQSSPHLTRHEK